MDNPSEYGGFCAFRQDNLVKGRTLVVPIMVVWREYCRYCGAHGFPRMGGARFVLMMTREPEIEIKERDGARGRLSRYFTGVGFNGKEDRRACNA